MQDCPSDFQGTEYRTKLKSVLAQPFDAKELDILEESAKCRKPVQRLRQMRGRVVDVVTEDEGFSYLDHHQGESHVPARNINTNCTGLNTKLRVCLVFFSGDGYV